MNEQFYYNEFELDTSFEADKSSGNPTFDGSSRIYNTLEFLLKSGFIEDGDRIIFKNEKDPSDFEFAEIIIPYKKPMLLWKGDFYPFTTLTKKLLLKHHIEITPRYCTKYWYLPDSQYSLYELTNFIKMIHKI